jgi:hypothetical protein
MIEEIKPCPFCASRPSFPEVKDVLGTCYDAGCENCGMAFMSIQIIDCFDYGESPNREDAHNSWDENNIKYGDEFVGIARDIAVSRWNDRAIQKRPLESLLAAYNSAIDAITEKCCADLEEVRTKPVDPVKNVHVNQNPLRMIGGQSQAMQNYQQCGYSEMRAAQGQAFHGGLLFGFGRMI